jgi:hypothetical protein
MWVLSQIILLLLCIVRYVPLLFVFLKLCHYSMTSKRTKKRCLHYILIFKLIQAVGGGVQLGPLVVSAIHLPIVPAPDDYEDGVWWNYDLRGKPKYSEKTCPSATLSTTNLTWPDRAQTRAAVMGNQRLTAWAMARPYYILAKQVVSRGQNKWHTVPHSGYYYDHWLIIQSVCMKIVCHNS